MFESSLSIRAAQRLPLQCGVAGRQRFTERKGGKRSQRGEEIGEERGVQKKVRGSKKKKGGMNKKSRSWRGDWGPVALPAPNAFYYLW